MSHARSRIPRRLRRLSELGLPGTIGEAEFQRWVVDVAAYFDWHGRHDLVSKAAVGGVFKSDALGWPDWFFWREDDGLHSGGVMLRELKIEGKHPEPFQRLMIVSLRRAGLDVDVWRPSDEERILAEFGRP